MLEGLATISAVLYANTNHPELKVDFPNWNERCKQILKKWRALSTDKKAPFLQKARENRSCMKKAQQVSQFNHTMNIGKCIYKIYIRMMRSCGDSSNQNQIEQNNLQVFMIFEHTSCLRILWNKKI